jgi:hypothetical protein
MMSQISAKAATAVRRLSKSAAALGAAGVLVAAGGAYALASDGATITACVSHKSGTLYKAKRCAKHDKKLSWSKTGPQGPPGPMGQTGAPGAAGATGAAGAPGDRGPSDAYIGSHNAFDQTVPNDGAQHEVLSISLPAGSYTLDGKLVLENETATSTDVHCLLNLGGATADESDVEVPTVTEVSVSLASVGSLTNSDTSTITCKSFSSTVNVGQIKDIATAVAAWHPA